MGSRRILMVAIATGMLAAFSVWGTLNGISAEYRGRAEMGPSLVARRSVAVGERLDGGSLEVRSIPRFLRQEGVLLSLEEVAGKVAAVGMFPGDQVTSAKVASPGEIRSLSGFLSTGLRAVAVKVSDVAMSLRLKPGDRVDVIGIWNDTTDGHELAKTVVADAEVIAVGAPRPEGVAQGALSLGNEPAGGDGGVILAVSPEEGQRIALLQNIGDMTITLRSAGDRSPSPLGTTELGQPSGVDIKRTTPLEQMVGVSWEEPFPVFSKTRPQKSPTADKALDDVDVERVKVNLSLGKSRLVTAPQEAARFEENKSDDFRDGSRQTETGADVNKVAGQHGQEEAPLVKPDSVLLVEVYRGAERSVQEVPDSASVGAGEAIRGEARVDGMEH